MDPTIDHVDDATTLTYEKSNGIKNKEDTKDDSEVLMIYTDHQLQLKQKITISDVISYKNAKSMGMRNDDQNQKHLPKGEDPRSSTAANEKNMPKMADNFRALGINIGSWTWTSSREGDLMAKLYYQKSGLIWEFLNDGLKYKMQIDWSHITAIRAELDDPNQPSSLEIELNQPPLFFKESPPQPRKHTNWVRCKDFTEGQAASKFRRHYVIFPPGVLNKPFQKLMARDNRLYNLSQMPFPNDADTSPYFDGIGPAGNLTDQQGSPILFTPTNSSEPSASEVENLKTYYVNIQVPSYKKAIQGCYTQNGEINGSMENVNRYNAVMNYGYRVVMNLAMMQNVDNNFGQVDSVLALNSPENVMMNKTPTSGNLLPWNGIGGFSGDVV